MAYNTELEDLLDEETATWSDLTKKGMFGGMGYLLNGNMCVGIWRNFLIGRVGPDGEKLMRKSHTSAMDITGKPMKGWVKVDRKGWKSKPSREAVISLARAFVSTLPRK